ncbi:HAMP domain-containing sensor histidine kinase [Janibacter cremeus]|uniref:sensor histidine kinase n=1 Tax=Janibacter cremeus TaxID=1285192 RepID=UPI0023F6BD1D|nr:HAMP domain-containing sensor histidine kinase [Janibacter cremeus]WEV79402.1 HAMP domain-containing sensor histidine kinase [Janibacter cremeus]
MSTEAPTRRRRPRLSRETIVGWMVLILFVTLLSVVIVVHETLRLSVTDSANADVTQEIQEFRTFTQEGVDPETSRPFTSAERLLQVYLSRQQPSPDEMLVGYVGTEGTVTISRGARAPTAEAYDLTRDQELLERTTRSASGTHETPAGEMRWARTIVEVADGEDAVLLVTFFTEPAMTEADQTVRMLVMASVFALLLAGVVSWVVAGRLLRPVRLVHAAAEEITEQDLTRRIDVGDDDVSGLASTFNRMLDRLEEAFRAEQRFVDDAGHELRTPITVIRGHLELMDDDPVSRERTMRVVTQELDRMSRIVTDLLALAKADRPDFIRPVAGVDVSMLTVALEAKISALADRRWRVDQIAEGEARLDSERVTQAVLQLAQNAVQHTTEGDAITLTSEFIDDPQLGHALAISIGDTGPGVAVADRERIFQRFTHGEPPDGRRHSGAGLGLAIVSAIAEGHDGRVRVGGAPGQGAVFTLLIPVEHDHSSQDGLVPSTAEG